MAHATADRRGFSCRQNPLVVGNVGQRGKDRMKARLARLLFAGAMIFGGCAMLWAAAGWRGGVGVFLVLWGHYLEKHHRGGVYPRPDQELAE